MCVLVYFVGNWKNILNEKNLLDFSVKNDYHLRFVHRVVYQSSLSQVAWFGVIDYDKMKITYA